MREKLRPVIVEAAQTARFLAGRGIVLNTEAHASFLDNVEDEFLGALNRLDQLARGDYSPDEACSSNDLEVSESGEGLQWAPPGMGAPLQRLYFCQADLHTR